LGKSRRRRATIITQASRKKTCDKLDAAYKKTKKKCAWLKMKKTCNEFDANYKKEKRECNRLCHSPERSREAGENLNSPKPKQNPFELRSAAESGLGKSRRRRATIITQASRKETCDKIKCDSLDSDHKDNPMNTKCRSVRKGAAKWMEIRRVGEGQKGIVKAIKKGIGKVCRKVLKALAAISEFFCKLPIRIAQVLLKIAQVFLTIAQKAMVIVKTLVNEAFDAVHNVLMLADKYVLEKVVLSAEINAVKMKFAGSLHVIKNGRIDLVADRSGLSKTVPITVNRTGCNCTTEQQSRHHRGSGGKRSDKKVKKGQKVLAVKSATRKLGEGLGRRRRRKNKKTATKHATKMTATKTATKTATMTPRCVAACKNPNPPSVPCSAQCTPPSSSFAVSMKPQIGDDSECDVFVFKAEAHQKQKKGGGKQKVRGKLKSAKKGGGKQKVRGKLKSATKPNSPQSEAQHMQHRRLEESAKHLWRRHRAMRKLGEGEMRRRKKNKSRPTKKDKSRPTKKDKSRPTKKDKSRPTKKDAGRQRKKNTSGRKMKFQCQRTTETPTVTEFKLEMTTALVATFPVTFPILMFEIFFMPIIKKGIATIKKKIKEAMTGGEEGNAKKRRLESESKAAESESKAADAEGAGMKEKLELQEREFDELYEAHLADEMNDSW